MGQEAITLNKGDIAPYKGTLLPDNQLTSIHKDLLELDGLRLINESYSKSILLYKENNTLLESKNVLLLNRNDELANSLQSARETSSWERFAWFALGGIAVGTLAYGYTKAIGK